MTTYLWAIDTPWAKKGEEYKPAPPDFTITRYRTDEDPEMFLLQTSTLLSLGWIKPVEDKKLTEEEILGAITDLKIRVKALEKRTYEDPAAAKHC